MAGQTRILFCDDDRNICELARLYLEKEGFSIDVAYNGREAFELFEINSYDLIILDIMMPEMDGYETCREIRKTSFVPIIFLSAKSETFDKVLGLELGADDYITKPFDVKELIARIKAILRRADVSGETASQNSILEFDNMTINMENYELIIDGEAIEIPPKELNLLHFLASNPNKVFTRDQLLSSVWGYDYFGDSRTVDVHIKRIREKIDGKSEKWNLKTVWGIGYKFEA